MAQREARALGGQLGADRPKKAANVALWYEAWHIIMDEGPIRTSDLAARLGVSICKTEELLTGMSIHWIPVYEEIRGAALYFGAARALSDERLDELLEYTRTLDGSQ